MRPARVRQPHSQTSGAVCMVSLLAGLDIPAHRPRCSPAYTLVLSSAFGGLGAALGPTLVAALWWKRVPVQDGVASMAVGTVSMPVWPQLPTLLGSAVPRSGFWSDSSASTGCSRRSFSRRTASTQAPTSTAESTDWAACGRSARRYSFSYSFSKPRNSVRWASSSARIVTARSSVTGSSAASAASMSAR